MNNQEMSQAEHMLLKAYQSCEIGNYDASQQFTEISLSYDNNNIDAHLFYISLLITIGNRSFHDMNNNKTKAMKQLKYIISKRDNGEFTLNERQKIKYQEIVKNYGEFIEYVSDLEDRLFE